jgi:hypothetical protein
MKKLVIDRPQPGATWRAIFEALKRHGRIRELVLVPVVNLPQR